MSSTFTIKSIGWDKIWRLIVPHKLKILPSRFFRNNMSVRNVLRSNGVATTIICPMCERDVEHPCHVFFDRSFATQCWHTSGLQYDMSQVEVVPLWLLDRLMCELLRQALNCISTLGYLVFQK